MESFEKWPRLAAIHTPDDLRRLPQGELKPLAEEIREYLTFRVGENGGHLASNLGVVELTMAIHRVFRVPEDHLIFDVGHQSYVHKLLTGRKERFDTLRRAGGISGFTKRAESVYDAFGAGHSSTAVSAAIGMAEADALAGRDAYTVAVVGDGAMTGGLAYEGLNNCRRDLRLIIILNENEMSISPNTGRLSEHLSHLRASRRYLRTKEVTERALARVPLLGKPTERALRWAKRRLKHTFYRENLFEHMGIRYLGPIDGNDLEGVTACLEHAKHLGCSVILHVKTVKGKGNAQAEAEPDLYHSVAVGKPAGKSFSTHFGAALVEAAAQDARVCAITAAMSQGTGLEPFRLAHPRRFFDVGIAEGHAVTFAAGLAAGGERPVVAVYSTFLQRALDHVIHDAALQDLPLVLAIDRAGFNSGDGVTHHGVFDVAYLSAVAGVKLFTPQTGAGIAASLRVALQGGGVCAIRYPAGAEEPRILAAFYPDGCDPATDPGVRVYESGNDPVCTIVTHGRIASEALRAAEVLLTAGMPVRILLCEYLAPYGDLSAEIAPLLTENTVFFEEEIRSGGFGMCLADALMRRGALTHRQYAIVAADTPFAVPLEGESVLHAAGVDAEALIDTVKGLISKNTK